MRKSPLKIKDSAFRTEVENAKDAVGMEVNTPAELDGVKSELIARNVDRAVGFITNQPMTVTAGTCRRCNWPLSSVTLGEPAIFHNLQTLRGRKSEFLISND